MTAECAPSGAFNVIDSFSKPFSTMIEMWNVLFSCVYSSIIEYSYVFIVLILFHVRVVAVLSIFLTSLKINFSFRCCYLF